MKFFTLFAAFLKGNGTVRELLRQLTTALLTALIALGLVYVLRTKQPPAVAPDSLLIQDVLTAQHRADSVQALLNQWKMQHRIDSLTLLLLHRHALDSMRANAGLSTLDAMRQINGAIKKR